MDVVFIAERVDSFLTNLTPHVALQGICGKTLIFGRFDTQDNVSRNAVDLQPCLNHGLRFVSGRMFSTSS